MNNDKNLSDAQASAIMQGMLKQAGTLFRILDRDGDGVLSAEEIANAPQVLGALCTSDDGCLYEKDFGGATEIPGMLRRSAIVRVLDFDGDLVIGPDDIEAASERIFQLDVNATGQVTALDDLPPRDPSIQAKVPMGTPAETLAYQKKMFTRTPYLRGQILPSGAPDVQPGYMLIHEVNDRGDMQKSNRTFLMDEHGKVARTWQSENRLSEATVSYLLPDGSLLRTSSKRSFIVMDGKFPIGANGTITKLDKDNNVLWEWDHFEIGVEALHHDIELMPNGNILAISWSVISAEKAKEMGWIQQGTHQRIILDKLYEIEPDYESGRGADVVWVWDAADHIIQDHDPKLANYGNPADHPGRLDINFTQLDTTQFNAGQLFHTNSVSYRVDEDIIMLSSAVFGEIWAIDHSTTSAEAATSSGGTYDKGGDLIWRFGNPQTHKSGGPEDQVLYWQHDAYFIPDTVPHKGDILIYNNGMRRTKDGKPDAKQVCMGVISGAYAEVLEITLPRDENGKLVMGAPPDEVWNFNKDAHHDLYSPFMSNAQRLPNGNTITMQAFDKRIVEVTSTGEVVLDFYVDGPGRMYRVYKYPPDDPAIRALGL